MASKQEKDATEKATQGKDSTLEKFGEYKDYAAQAKDATAQKAEEYKDYTARKAEETKDSIKEKMGEYKDSVADEAEQAKDVTAEKAGEFEDRRAEKAEETGQKAGEYKDYTAEKAAERKDTAFGTIGELKDTAVDTARGAVDFLTGKNEEGKESTSENKDLVKVKYGDTEDVARKKIADLRIKEDEHKSHAGVNKTHDRVDAAGRKLEGPQEGGVHMHMDETKMRAEVEREVAADRGVAGHRNILGAMASVSEAIKGKLTQPSDIVAERRADAAPDEGDEVVVDAEKTRPGYVASILKASDQMSGQTFNDVGRMRDETLERVDRYDRA